ncbi:hypothetical protein IWW55_006970, partial [Coemansia sp. RSA 2706]
VYLEKGKVHDGSSAQLLVPFINAYRGLLARRGSVLLSHEHLARHEPRGLAVKDRLDPLMPITAAQD